MFENKNDIINTRGLFADYPDVVTTKQCAEMLRICNKTVYALINEGKLKKLPIKHKNRILKMSIIEYVLNAAQEVA